MRRCVWSRNLKNEEAMARVGPQRHKGGGSILPMLLRYVIIKNAFLRVFFRRVF